MSETEAGTNGLRLEVSAEDDDAAAVAETSRVLLAHPTLRYEFPAGDLWLVRFEVSDKAGGAGRFSALVQDTESGRSVAAQGLLGEPSSVMVTPLSPQRAPNDEEFAWAVAALAEDEELGPLLAQDGVSTYRPAPPLANMANPDGDVERVITVGIRSEGAEPLHRIVGVRTGDGAVITDLPNVPSAWNEECGVVPGPECPFPSGPGHVRVRVMRGDIAVWDLVVVRPSSSTGTNGSGVELRRVDHKGQRVLARAHVPIVNLRHEDGGGDGDGKGDGDTASPRCAAAFRSWQHDESCFRAPGDDAAPGFRVCSQAPSTILDEGDDEGDFRGVALWLDGDELLILSQLRAGWHRYVSEWRLLADGTIKPRFGFATVQSPCACLPRVNHAYWRFDFDILGAANNLVQEYNDQPVVGTGNWHTTRYEVRRPRDASANRFWRVRNVRSSQGYSLLPGEGDGAADDYGLGDVWILRQSDLEVDDGHGVTTDPALSRAHLDRFVSGESVERQDVVVWYSGHQAQSSGDPGPRIGPDLVPSNWRDLPLAGPTFAPPVPPARPS